MRISTRLSFGFGTLMAILATVAGIGLWSAGNNSRRTAEVRERHLPEAAVAQQVVEALRNAHFAILAGVEAGSTDGLRKVEAAHATAGEALVSARKRISGGSPLAAPLEQLAGAFPAISDKGKSAVRLSIDQDIVAQAEALKQYQQLYQSFEGGLGRFEAAASGALNEALEDIATGSRRLAILTLVIAVLGVGVGLIVAVSLVRRIRSSLENALRFSNGLAAGDLTASFTSASRDEFETLARTLNQMTSSLREMIEKVGNAFSDLEVVSHDIAEVSHRIAEGSAGQTGAVSTVSSSIEQMNASIKSVVQSVENLFNLAGESSASMLEMSASVGQVVGNTEGLSAAVERSSASITQMTASIRNVAEHVASLADLVTATSSAITEIDSVVREIERNAGQGHELSREVARTMSEEGLVMLRRTAEGMSDIRNAVARTAAVIRNLEERSHEIGGILGVINEVNEQTNLLALNAAILAAQAGEHGRGFAVVAEEIRELSARTASSTKEITDLIEGVREETKNAVVAMEEGTRKVEEGVTTVASLGETLRRAAEDSEQASAASRGIAQATAEQYKGVRQIAASSQKINEMSQEIARSTREQAAGSAQIVKAAEEMRELAQQVRKAMTEQAAGIRLTSRASEESARLSQQVLDATREEAAGSDLVVKNIGAIQDVTNTNSAAVTRLDQMVRILAAQAKLLKQELSRFKVH